MNENNELTEKLSIFKLVIDKLANDKDFINQLFGYIYAKIDNA